MNILNPFQRLSDIFILKLRLGLIEELIQKLQNLGFNCGDAQVDIDVAKDAMYQAKLKVEKVLRKT